MNDCDDCCWLRAELKSSGGSWATFPHAPTRHTHETRIYKHTRPLDSKLNYQAAASSQQPATQQWLFPMVLWCGGNNIPLGEERHSRAERVNQFKLDATHSQIRTRKKYHLRTFPKLSSRLVKEWSKKIPPKRPCNNCTTHTNYKHFPSSYGAPLQRLPLLISQTQPNPTDDFDSS